MSDAMDALRALGARFSPSFDAFASGEITVGQIQCLLCGKAPCVCRPCPKCTWHGPLVTVKRVADPGVGCGGDCGSCPGCLTRLPVHLVELMARSKNTVPAVYETAVRCAGMWLRAHQPVGPRSGRDKRHGGQRHARQVHALKDRPVLWGGSPGTGPAGDRDRPPAMRGQRHREQRPGAAVAADHPWGPNRHRRLAT